MKKYIFTLVFILAVGRLSMDAQPVHSEEYSSDVKGYGPVGGTAPIGGGITLIVALAAAYGIKKHQLNIYRT
jgi:hypothetical protein